MFMFLKIALGNILKNRRSSVTIITVVFVCVFTMQFGTGYIDGFKEKMTSDFLKQAGHVNIYNPVFYEEQDFSMMEHNIPFDSAGAAKLRKVPGVQTIRPEINFGAIANTEEKNLQCMVKGIDIKNPGENYAQLAGSIIDGGFIKGESGLMIGYKAAALLNVKTGDNLVILSVDQYGGITAVEGKISGLFKVNNASDDETLVVCPLAMAQKLLSMEGRVISIAVNFSDPWAAPEHALSLQKVLPEGIVAVPWQEGKSFIVSMLEMFDVMVIIVSFIIVFAASMGIINSFLMNLSLIHI